MTYNSEMTDEQFTRNLQALLQRELGPGGFARFLRLYCSGNRDYTRERSHLINGLTIEQIELQSGN